MTNNQPGAEQADRASGTDGTDEALRGHLARVEAKVDFIFQKLVEAGLASADELGPLEAPRDPAKEGPAARPGAVTPEFITRLLREFPPDPDPETTAFVRELVLQVVPPGVVVPVDTLWNHPAFRMYEWTDITRAVVELLRDRRLVARPAPSQREIGDLVAGLSRPG